MINDRSNDSGDEVPILADAYRYDRLNVQYVLSAIVCSDVEIAIVLEGYADEACNWILYCLSRELARSCSDPL